MGADDYLLEALAGAVQGFGNVYIPRKQAEYENSLLMQRQQAQSSADFNLFKQKLPLEQAKDIAVAQAKDASKEHTIGEMYPSGTPRPSEFTPDLDKLPPSLAAPLIKNRSESSGKTPILKSDAIKMAQSGETIPKDSLIIDDTKSSQTEEEKQQARLEAKKAFAKPNVIKAIGEFQANADSTIKKIDRLLKNPNLGDALGWKGTVYGKLPATDAQAILADINSIKSAMSLDALTALKNASPTGASGLASLSDAEGKRLENARANLETKQKEKDFITQLKDAREVLSGAKQRAINAYELDYGEPYKPIVSTEKKRSLNDFYNSGN